MSKSIATQPRPPALEAYLLGRVDFDDALQLQRRLVYEAGHAAGGNVSLLLCEHPPLITIGRAGSRGHIRRTEEQLKHRRIAVRYVARGGGCVVHGPGQLAIYPIVSLAQRAWSVGEFLARFQSGINDALADVGVAPRQHAGHYSLWGRTGVLAAFGAAVKHEATCHGAFVDVQPERGLQGYVDVIDPATAPPGEKAVMSSLLSERSRPVRMSRVRSAVATRLAETFSCPRHHVRSGHPLLQEIAAQQREPDFAHHRTAHPLA